MNLKTFFLTTLAMIDMTKELTEIKSLKLLRDGFKYDFATFAYADSRMTELLQELASEFVDTNVPITKEDYKIDLALMLMETLDIVAR